MRAFIVSTKNQARLRALLIEVRTRHGLSQEDFAPLVGMGHSMLSSFERGKQDLGYGSMRKVAKALSLNPEMVAAMFDVKAPPIRLPSAKSISLPVKVPVPGPISDMLIDLETAAKMIGAISAAGRALPLAQLLQFVQ